jgi:myo-inositol 2-dehydrogenase/D-chiro-inositol 1-dehydrogenase
MTKPKQEMSRRDFCTSSLGAAGGLLLVTPRTAFGTSANSLLRLGILGCGGRGSHVAQAFVENTNTVVVALADLFQDRLDQGTARFKKLQSTKGSPAIKLYKGPESYLQLLASDIDLVIISTPPYFHPQHLKAALDAGGKHVYLEKPVATDVRGCMEVAKLVGRPQGKVSVDVGFQMRRAPYYVEQTRRIHDGAIGEVALAQGFYFAGDVPRKNRGDVSPLEAQIRDWWFSRALSGDVLVEQNVHIIDVFNWVLKQHPVTATATGGRRVRTDVGDVYDHFIVTYQYPNDIHASFMSTQFLPKWGDVATRFFGKKGQSEAFFVGGLRIEGDNPWEAGADQVPVGTKPEVDPLREATPEKAKAFVQSIQTGQFHNELGQGVESCLSAMLGRQAAYEGGAMTWDQLIASDQHWDFEIDLSKL